MKREIHHTTTIKELGNCLICCQPFLNYWYNESEQNGVSDTYVEKKIGIMHFTCTNGKSLKQLNEERRLSL